MVRTAPAPRDNSARPIQSIGAGLRRFRAGLRRFGAGLRGAGGELREIREQWKRSTPRQRRRRRLIVAGVVAALLAYPVLGTFALWTGFVEWALRSEDLRVDIDNPAYTIWPGRIHLRRVLIAVNGETQFTLEANELAMSIAVPPLFQRRFQVTGLRGDGVRYRMRVQVESDAGIKERLAAYPPLPELPGAKVIKETEAARTEQREPDWTVQVDGIEVSVVELWFMEYRYLGDGTLRGAFLVGPNRMWVASSVQDLGPGELRFGPDHLIARDFGGRVTAEIPELNPNEHADESFLDFVTARVQLSGAVDSLRHISAYVDGINVDAGKGRFKADVGLEKGHLGKQSQIRYDTDKVRLMGKGFGVETDFTLDMAVAVPAPDARGDPEPIERDEEDLPRIHASARATYVSFAKDAERAFTIQIHDHEHEAVLKSNQVGSQMSLKRASLHFPAIVSKDFDDLGAALTGDPPLRVERGEARASLRLLVDERHVARGRFDARMEDARFHLAGVDVESSARVRTSVRADLRQKNVLLEDLDVRVADVSMRVGDESVDDWWLHLASDRVFFAKGPPQRYEAKIGLYARDAEPVLEALAEKDQLNDIIPKLTSLGDLRAILTLRGKGEASDVMVSSLESNVWDVAGRFWSKGEQNRFALVLGGEAVSVGIASDGERTEIKPFARDRWLNEKLRRFPDPIEQVRPSKP